MVEYALVAPLLFLLLFGVIEFGRAIATYTAVSTAAREGARYSTAIGESPYTSGVARYVDCDGIEQAAAAKATMLDWDRSQIAIRYDSGPGTPVKATCGTTTPPSEGTVLSGDRVVVEVTTEFTSPIPLISSFLGTLDVSSEQARSIFKGKISG